MRRSFRASIVMCLCLTLAAVTTLAFAGPGDLDKTFSGDGVKTVDYSGLGDTFYGVAIHGNAPTTCGTSSSQATLTAFTAGGGLNKNFSGDGMWRQDILGHGYSYLEACRFLHDGRLVAAGGATGADGNDRMIVVVRRPNGKPDTSFSGDGLAVFRFKGVDNSDAYDLAIQPDGKIDTTFSGDGLAKVDFNPYDEGAWKVVLLHDGTIVLAGWVWDNATSEWNTAVARLKPNGALDGSFSGNGKATFNFLKGGNDDYALGLDVRSDGSVVLGVYRNNGAYPSAVAQLKPNGKPDGSFGGGDGLKTGLGTDLNLQDLMLVGGGKILIAGRSGGGSAPFLMRLKPSGALDGTFGTNGSADLSTVSGYLFDIALDAKGRIDGAGNAVSDGLLLRVHA